MVGDKNITPNHCYWANRDINLVLIHIIGLFRPDSTIKIWKFILATRRGLRYIGWV